MSEAKANAAAYFVDRHLSGRAGKPAFIESKPGGRTLTYGELASRSDRMAALYERHGVRREDRNDHRDRQRRRQRHRADGSALEGIP